MASASWLQIGVVVIFTDEMIFFDLDWQVLRKIMDVPLSVIIIYFVLFPISSYIWSMLPLLIYINIGHLQLLQTLSIMPPVTVACSGDVRTS